MKSMEIRITFLTPAFLYGADQNKSEFRIPSLIGQMRYWWRMTQDWSDIENLRKKEGEVFGMVAGNKARAKPFFIQLKDKSVFALPPLEEGRKGDGSRIFSFPSKDDRGISYFFYPFMRRPEDRIYTGLKQLVRPSVTTHLHRRSLEVKKALIVDDIPKYVDSA